MNTAPIISNVWGFCTTLRDDGSGAFLFLLYLRQEGMRLPLDENGLVALTLLIAEIDPKAKDLMVRPVMNLLAAPGEHETNPEA